MINLALAFSIQQNQSRFRFTQQTSIPSIAVQNPAWSSRSHPNLVFTPQPQQTSSTHNFSNQPPLNVFPIQSPTYFHHQNRQHQRETKKGAVTNVLRRHEDWLRDFSTELQTRSETSTSDRRKISKRPPKSPTTTQTQEVLIRLKVEK